mgnify:CR=1 FL=1
MRNPHQSRKAGRRRKALPNETTTSYMVEVVHLGEFEDYAEARDWAEVFLEGTEEFFVATEGTEDITIHRKTYGPRGGLHGSEVFWNGHGGTDLPETDEVQS